MRFLFLLILFVFHSPFFASLPPTLRLWYTSPSKSLIPDSPSPSQDDTEWVKSLPLGNGFIGAMVFGDINQERVQLNEKTLWSGSPQDANNIEAPEFLDTIREALFDGDYKKAHALASQTQRDRFKNSSSSGQGANLQFGCFQTLGDLWIDFNRSGVGYSNYQRELNLEEGIVKIYYDQDGTHYNREAFTSYSKNVFVLKMSCNKSSCLEVSASLSRPEAFRTYMKEDSLVMEGQLDDGDGGKGMRYMAKMRLQSKDGRINYENDKIVVKEASEIIIYISAATDYLPKYPDFKGNPYEAIIDDNLKHSFSISYEDLLQEHLLSYRKLFGRVSLTLTEEQDLIPTDLRLKNYQTNPNDLHLEQLAFQYGRYLLISSSNPNSSLPANLQGIWANKIQTPWNGDYHTDINVQMNYWLAEVTNLAEVHLPLIKFIEMLSHSGRVTAKEQYNKTGWVLHTLTNPWGFTAPGEDPGWGLTLGLTAWMCQHLWEHFLFNVDREYLNEVFPIMLEAANFYLDWLVVDPVSKKLVSGPTTSPENSFIAPDLVVTSISMGSAHDQETIFNLFDNVIEAARILKITGENIQKIKMAKQSLLVPSIGSDGRLMEWAFPFQETELGHRHMSHLWGLYPGNQINNITTPDLCSAAQKSLEYRLSHGGGSTGWSSAWTISLWARLKNGDKARVGLQNNLQRSSTENLFDECPPFQIDGNFGNAAGIAEMLIQSHLGFLEILPALPSKWEKGNVKGLQGRGGFEVDIAWEGNRMVEVGVFSKEKTGVMIKWEEHTMEVNFEKGERKIIKREDFH